MIETPQIVNSPLMLTAAIHLLVPRDQIRSVMRPLAARRSGLRSPNKTSNPRDHG